MPEGLLAATEPGWRARGMESATTARVVRAVNLRAAPRPGEEMHRRRETLGSPGAGGLSTMGRWRPSLNVAYGTADFEPATP